MNESTVAKLKKAALQVRMDCINIQKLVGSGHLGGVFFRRGITGLSVFFPDED